MNQEIKKLWINALVSGEYTQAKDSLKKNDSFCCLGVLCDLYRKETGAGKWIEEKLFDINFEYAFQLSGELDSTTLPSIVSEWAGLSKIYSNGKKIFYYNPIVIVNGVRITLGNANDRHLNFEQIAKVIEEQL